MKKSLGKRRGGYLSSQEERMRERKSVRNLQNREGKGEDDDDSEGRRKKKRKKGKQLRKRGNETGVEIVSAREREIKANRD